LLIVHLIFVNKYINYLKKQLFTLSGGHRLEEFILLLFLVPNARKVLKK